MSEVQFISSRQVAPGSCTRLLSHRNRPDFPADVETESNRFKKTSEGFDCPLNIGKLDEMDEVTKSCAHYEISRKCRDSILNNERNYEEKIINSNNLGKFYRHANRKFCSKTGIGAIKLDNGSLSTNEASQAEAFNKYFSSVFTLDNQILPNFDLRTDHILGNITFNPTIVCRVLKGLKQDSSPGPDNIAPIFLKTMANELASPLSYLFEHFFINGYVPSIWRSAYIVPVYKKNDSTLTSNYRPISLTSSCCKVMEKIIHDQMMEFFAENNLVTKQQHGFLKRHSTSTNLLECLADWTLALNDKLNMDIIYIDYSRAFDSVVHSKLIHKLKCYGIQYELLTWIESFLTNRQQCVKVGNHFSSYSPVYSGIAQGSVLGALMFIIYINDLVDLIGVGVSCKLFADDVKLYSLVDGNDFTNSLNSSLLELHKWSINWQMNINVEKMFCFTPRIQEFSLCI